MNKALKIVSACILLLAVLVATGYIIFVPDFEKKQAERIAELLRMLPGEAQAESITVHLLRNKVELSNISARITERFAQDMDIHIDSALVSGIHVSAATARDITTLADSLIVKGINITGAGRIESIAQEEFKLDELSVKNLRGDVQAILAGLRAQQRIAGMYIAASTMSADSYTTKGYTYSANTAAGPLTVFCDSINAQDVALLSSGRTVLHNMRVDLNDEEVLRLERMENEAMSIPDMYTPMLAVMESVEEDPEKVLLETSGDILVSALRKRPLSIKGLKLHNLTISHYELDADLTLAEFLLDMQATPETLTITSSVNDLMLPPVIYASLGSEPQAFADAYGKALHFSSAAAFTAHNMNGEGSLKLSRAELNEQALGAVALTLDIPFSGDSKDLLELFSKDASAFLRSATLTVDDRGFVNQYIAGQVYQLQQFGLNDKEFASAESLRDMAVQSVRAQAGQYGETEVAQAIEGAAKLLEQPGILRISVQPEPPAPLESLPMALQFGTIPLNLNVEYTAHPVE